MPKKTPESDCLCPTSDDLTDTMDTMEAPEVLNVLEKTMEAFYRTVTEYGLEPSDAIAAGAFVAAAIGDGIFDIAMPDEKKADAATRKRYAGNYVDLVESYLANMMELTFDEEGDEGDEEATDAEMEIFSALNTRH
jgi:hypothetical protein